MSRTSIARMTRFYIRHYSDNGETKAYAEWEDTAGVAGRTEGDVPMGLHMTALMLRGIREGIAVEQETW